MKALEQVLEKAKCVFAVTQNLQGADRIADALLDLQGAIQEADKLPPIHMSSRS